jgi:UPF0716 protein FxsA
MFFRLFLLFTLIPLVELYLLIRIGGLIGAGPTVLLVLGTGAAGAWLARREGFRSWIAVQHEMAAGRLPAAELLHALLIVIAGALLVTPGVFTDAAGLLMLFRPVRTSLIRRVQGRINRKIETGDMRVWVQEGEQAWTGASTDDQPEPRPRVIDV